MKNILFILLFITNSFSQTNEITFGADISSLLKIEDNGGQYFVNGQSTDLLEILKANNIEYIRVRIWHTPNDNRNNLDETIILARRIKDLGMKFLLDFHYSDTWADPGQQQKPAAWAELNFEQLRDSIYHYTNKVITTLKKLELLPDMVQLGNEISCGFLWDDGKVCGQNVNSENWNKLADLLQSAKMGISDAIEKNDSVKIMIHIADGANKGTTQWFFDNLLGTGFDFDVIGFSYYPWWHGTLDKLIENLEYTAAQYKKDIYIVETSYPWTLGWADNKHNIIGLESQLLDGFPATVNGQQKYFEELIKISKNIAAVKGLMLWEPGTIVTPNIQTSRENLTLFDFDGELLSSISAFFNPVTGLEFVSKVHQDKIKITSYPNPSNPNITINFELAEKGVIIIDIINLLGEKITSLIDQEKSAGSHLINYDMRGYSSGIYFIRFISKNNVLCKKVIILH